MKQRFIRLVIKCHECRGTGKSWIKTKCPVCKGTGYVTRKEAK